MHTRFIGMIVERKQIKITSKQMNVKWGGKIESS